MNNKTVVDQVDLETGEVHPILEEIEKAVKERITVQKAEDLSAYVSTLEDLFYMGVKVISTGWTESTQLMIVKYIEEKDED